MPSLFENAIASIRMGVEDFQLEDDDRDISAVRNLFAGVLLLAKEALVRQAPNADPRDVIWAAFKPVPDGQGDLTFIPDRNNTVDFSTIAARFKDFGLKIDSGALSDLHKIRNAMEHHFAHQPGATIRAAIIKAFPVVSSLFRQIDETPSEWLGQAWAVMMEDRSLYEHERAAAAGSLAKVAWFAPFLEKVAFTCDACDLDLLEQVDPDNAAQDAIEFRCRKCAARPDREDIIERAVEVHYGAESHIRAKEGISEGPTYDCTECSRETYLEDEDCCANCGYVIDYTAQCLRCHNGISIQDYLDGNDSGVCGYCQNVWAKMEDE